MQACPNEAIRITRRRSAPRRSQAAEANAFLPGAPAPGRHAARPPSTRPRAPLPRNLLPADFYSVSPEHAHPPLVVMLVLTQLSVGAFVVDLVAPLAGRAAPRRRRRRPRACCALALGAGGAGREHAPPRPAALRLPRRPRAAHLVAQPRDRRVLGCFAGLARGLRRALAARLPLATGRRSLGAGARRRRPAGSLGVVLLGDGLRGHPARALARLARPGSSSLGTTVVLGAATVLSSRLAGARRRRRRARRRRRRRCRWPSLVRRRGGSSSLVEAAVFRHLRRRRTTRRCKRAALLMRGDLRPVTGCALRCAASLGGVAAARAGRLARAAAAATPAARRGRASSLALLARRASSSSATCSSPRRPPRRCREGSPDDAATLAEARALRAGLLRSATDRSTRELLLTPGGFGLGQVPARLSPTRRPRWSAASAPPAAG